MHSYDNGVNIVKRKDNWRQLCKFFQRADIPYTDDEVGRIIHYEKGATVDFVNRLYTLLTQRRVKAPPVRQRHVGPPPFAKDTASLALKQRLRDPEMSEVSDLQTQEAALKKRLQEHVSSLETQREADREAASSLREKIAESAAADNQLNNAEAAKELGAEKLKVVELEEKIRQTNDDYVRIQEESKSNIEELQKVRLLHTEVETQLSAMQIKLVEEESKTANALVETNELKTRK
jgi:hypothetical protein